MLIPFIQGLLAFLGDVNSPAHQSLPMGKQHNKIIKRSRRKEYLKRKKDQVKATIALKKSTPAKKTAKKAAKKAAVKKTAVKKAAAKKTAVKKTAAKKAVKKTAAKKTAKKAAKKAAPKKED